MMLRLLVVTALAAAVLAGTTTAACACSCVEFKPAQAVQNATAVFTGTVVAIRTVKGPPNAQKVYTFRADNVYKGAPAAEFQIGADTDSPACGYVFDQDTRYLVFAGPAERVPGVSLSTSLCSGNVPIRAGTGPLQVGDERETAPETLGGPVTTELITALGTPAQPGKSGTPGTSRSAVPWQWVAAVAVVTAATLAWYARRNRAK
ncbi:hypothetical protein [Nonomuraea endophytica]|uniref:Tissue inhibitor of metalloproteinase n=1 Tax=Nonomuraea endophytica TaxID=714136 RepID=A0A7W8AEM9_9ACTN|nr:hypothetical protein [Nonomuraea endophytica]MBB5084917.1 hypothetical protein [Nonomuraea endophytica]